MDIRRCLKDGKLKRTRVLQPKGQTSKKSKKQKLESETSMLSPEQHAAKRTPKASTPLTL